jgi:hypothetical protein
MPASYPVGATNVEGETLSLSTTLASLGIPPNVYQAMLYGPSSDFRMNLNPAIKDVYFYDASADAGSRYSSQTINLLDRSTSTGTGTAMDAATTSDYLYICLEEPAAGIRVVIGAANGNTSTLLAEYRQNDDSWTSLSATDGTVSSGDTLAVTGSITWTAVTNWKRGQLGGPNDPFDTTNADAPTTNGMWMRLSWNGALDSDTEIDSLWALNNDTKRGYFRTGQEYKISFDRRVLGSIECILASGTDTLQITWVRT